MSKTLYVLRHSKAGQTNKNILDDHERPLTQKGRQLCLSVAQELKKQHAQIDVVFCSTAKRCLETYENIKPHFPLSAPLELNSQLYLADAIELVRQVRRLSDAYSSALLIGHNPGLHEFCLQVMSPNSEKKQQRELKNQFSPPTLVQFSFAIAHWRELAFDGGALKSYYCPKNNK